MIDDRDAVTGEILGHGHEQTAARKAKPRAAGGMTSKARNAIKRRETPLYQAWCLDWSSSEVKVGERHEYGALHVKAAAELHARRIGMHVPAALWPSVVTIYVKDPLNGNREYIVEIGKVTTHDFHAQRATKAI